MIPLFSGETVSDELKAILEKTVSDCQNSSGSKPLLSKQVQDIIQRIRQGGDTALKELSFQLGDTLVNDSFELSYEQVVQAVERVPDDVKQLLERAANNISLFATAVYQSAKPVTCQQQGISVGLDWRPVERVACYVPGGRYPLPSTALMTTITAKVAGVKDINLVSPRLKDEIIYAGTLAGVSRFYQIGGAQAVAAMALGTESIKPVDMLVGPGNAYVTEAKRQLNGIIGIDMLAGPSEVAIIADKSAKPEHIAWDLLAQAEHDPDARAYLLTDTQALAESVHEVLNRILSEKSSQLAEHLHDGHWGAIFCLNNLQECIDAANQMAPEHLELLVEKPEALKDLLYHYGALFMGHQSPVPVGDYLAGPNHTLPTGKTARFSGGLTPMTFLRAQSWIKVEKEGSALLKDAGQFSELEGLHAHYESANARNM